MSKNIVHINVKLSGGGAATIARSLHLNCLKEGMNSVFLYGYGKNGSRDEMEGSVPNCRKISGISSVSANIFWHRIFGRDVFFPGFDDAVRDIFLKADIVHFHVLHSYFFPLEVLNKLRNLVSENCRFVWTLHDRWLFTGRCAIVDECSQWRSECTYCPTGDNYPPTMVRKVGGSFNRKKIILDGFKSKSTYVSPSRHLIEGVNGYNINVIENELPANYGEFANAGTNQKSLPRILIIANDLSDTKKTDPEWVLELCNISGISVICIGKNSPYVGDNIVNIGFVSNGSRLIDLMASCDIMMFTSEIDNYPTVIMEALVLGVFVVAKDSPGANEVLDKVGERSYKTIDAAITCIKKYIKSPDKNYRRSALKNKAREVYASNSWFDKYMSIYKKCGT